MYRNIKFKNFSFVILLIFILCNQKLFSSSSSEIDKVYFHNVSESKFNQQILYLKDFDKYKILIIECSNRNIIFNFITNEMVLIKFTYSESMLGSDCVFSPMEIDHNQIAFCTINNLKNNGASKKIIQNIFIIKYNGHIEKKYSLTLENEILYFIGKPQIFEKYSAYMLKVGYPSRHRSFDPQIVKFSNLFMNSQVIKTIPQKIWLQLNQTNMQNNIKIHNELITIILIRTFDNKQKNILNQNFPVVYQSSTNSNVWYESFKLDSKSLLNKVYYLNTQNKHMIGMKIYFLRYIPEVTDDFFMGYFSVILKNSEPKKIRRESEDFYFSIFLNKNKGEIVILPAEYQGTIIGADGNYFYLKQGYDNKIKITRVNINKVIKELKI